MSKSIDPTVIDGECQLCGMPGIVGMTCSECGGTIIGLTETKATATDDDPDRYGDDLLDDDTTKPLSLDELKDEEAATPDESFDDPSDI